MCNGNGRFYLEGRLNFGVYLFDLDDLELCKQILCASFLPFFLPLGVAVSLKWGETWGGSWLEWQRQATGGTMPACMAQSLNNCLCI